MYEAVLQARKEKIKNKTREKERARKGYWNAHTLRRMRQGPPAHIMAKLSPVLLLGTRKLETQNFRMT